MLKPAMWLMPLSLSNITGCSQLGATECLLQVPKTGSTFLKVSFGLPMNVDTSKLRGAQRHPESTCKQLVVPIRDPVQRFLSGLGTVHHRDCGRAASNTTKSRLRLGHHCAALRTMSDLTKFAEAILGILRRVLNSCADVGAMGYGQLSHMLPQSAFATLVSSRDVRLHAVMLSSTSSVTKQSNSVMLHAAMHSSSRPTHIAGSTNMDMSTFSGSLCKPRLFGKVNEAEGMSEAPVLRGINISVLPLQLVRSIVDLYSVDYTWLQIPRPT